MRIKRNRRLEGQIMDRARTFLENDERAAGIHVSSLLTPRKHYWQAVDPQPLNDKEVGFFIAGRAHHEVVLAIMKGEKEIGTSDAGSKEWEGIHYTPDFRLGFLAEIKTNRRQYAPPDEEPALLKEYDNYLAQLGNYMAVEDQERGSLIVFYISMRNDDENKTTYPRIMCYDITLTPVERRDIRHEMLDMRDLIKKALKKKDHTILPLCPAWQCTRGGLRGPIIEECKWYQKCKPEGRYPLELAKANMIAEKKKEVKRG